MNEKEKFDGGILIRELLLRMMSFCGKYEIGKNSLDRLSAPVALYTHPPTGVYVCVEYRRRECAPMSMRVRVNFKKRALLLLWIKKTRTLFKRKRGKREREGDMLLLRLCYVVCLCLNSLCPIRAQLSSI